MTWIDLAVLIILGYNIVTGFMNGLLRSLGHLAALGGAFILTPFVKPILTSMVALMFQLPPHLALPVGMALTWLGLYVSISIGIHIISKAVDESPLKLMNRLGGVGLGLLMAGAVILFPLAVIQSFPLLRDQPAIKQTLEDTALWKPALEPATYYVQTTLGPSLLGMWLGEEQKKLKQKPQTAPSPEA